MCVGRVVVLLYCAWMAASVEVPRIKMNDGRLMPRIALGTYLGFDQDGIVKPENKNVLNTIMKAIDLGYRHIDTAQIYETEEEIGEAIRMKIDEGVVSREDMFVTNKLWNTHHKREKVAEALRTSLQKLGLNYVDLYLMHWPIAVNDDYTDSDVDYMETWRGMEDVKRLGLAKSIGVSNFNEEQLKRLINESTVKPVALQIEVHLQIAQKELVAFAQSHDMVVMGYSPFGSLVARYGMLFPGPRIDDPGLVEIASKYKKTTPQVVLRWLVDRNIVPVAKSLNPKRLAQNIDIFDFNLEEYEIEKLYGYNENVRYTLPSFWQDHPYYPFEKVDNPLPSNPFRRSSS